MESVRWGRDVGQGNVFRGEVPLNFGDVEGRVAFVGVGELKGDVQAVVEDIQDPVGALKTFFELVHAALVLAWPVGGVKKYPCPRCQDQGICDELDWG